MQIEEKGIITIISSHTVDETVQRLKDLLVAKDVTLFACIDHSGEAEKVGLKMPPTKLLLFGSPRAGTPIMLAAPTSAIDLPLKILVWQDDAGAVRVSYNDPEYLAGRHAIPPALLPNIGAVKAFAKIVSE